MPSQLSSSKDILLEMLETLKASEEKVNQLLPEYASSVNNPALKQAIESITQGSQQRLSAFQQISMALGTQIGSGNTATVESMIQETKSLMAKRSPNLPIDIWLLASTQMVVSYLLHYYSYTSNMSKSLNLNPQITQLLSTSFSHMESINESLTQIAASILSELGNLGDQPSQGTLQPKVDQVKQQIESTKNQIKELPKKPITEQQTEIPLLKQQLIEQQQQIDQIQTTTQHPDQIKSEQKQMEQQVENQEKQLQDSTDTGGLKQKVGDLVSKLTK
jgi:ferritin-like metal-binding protein YciE